MTVLDASAAVRLTGIKRRTSARFPSNRDVSPKTISNDGEKLLLWDRNISRLALFTVSSNPVTTMKSTHSAISGTGTPGVSSDPASLVIPTYNERFNIEPLLRELYSLLRRRPDLDVEVIFVDDNSPDGTAKEIQRLSQSYPLRLVRRPVKSGLGSAVMEGFRESTRPVLGVMDADLSHDPAILADLIDAMGRVDVAIGSRFEEQSSVERWTRGRKWLSVAGVRLARRLTRVSDPLSGYFVLRREVVAPLLNEVLVSPGYKLLFEILCRGNYQTAESLPYTFRQRRHSASKLDGREYRLFVKQLIRFSVSRFSAFTPRFPVGSAADSRLPRPLSISSNN